MHGQLLHLAELAERPAVKVHVIPSEVGAHIGLLGPFAIAGLRTTRTALCISRLQMKERQPGNL